MFVNIICIFKLQLGLVLVFGSGNGNTHNEWNNRLPFF